MKLSEFDHVILSLDGNENDLSIAQNIRKKLAGIIKIRRGLTVDSGAADHAIPIGWLPALLFAVMQSIGSRSGLHYVAANGTRTPKVGQQLVRLMTMDGVWVELMFQLAGINKPLVSVSKLTEEGYRVIFDDQHSHTYHKRTKVINTRKDKGVYVIDAHVPKKKEQGFTRPRSPLRVP